MEVMVTLNALLSRRSLSRAMCSPAAILPEEGGGAGRGWGGDFSLCWGGVDGGVGTPPGVRGRRREKDGGREGWRERERMFRRRRC